MEDSPTIQSRARRDFLALAALMLSILGTALYYDLNEMLAAWVKTREQFELDEFIFTLSVGSITFGWYAYRRWRDYSKALVVSRINLEKAFSSKKQADTALAELQKRDKESIEQNECFNAALNNMSQGLCMFDGEQRLIVANARYASMYGLLPELVKPGTRLQEIIEYRIANGLYAGASPDEYRNERSNWGRDDTTEKKIQHFSDGRIIAVSPQPLTGGGWVTTHEDVTEVTQAQQVVQQQKNELKESMQRLDEAREVAGFGNWEWNIVTNDLIWSEEIYSIFGLQQNAFDASYDAFLNSVHPEDRQMVQDAVRQAVEEKKPYNLDHRIVLQDGEIRTVHEWGNVTYDTDGKPFRMIGIIQDITDRKRVECELIEHRDHLQELIDKATQELKGNAEELKEALAREQELNKLQREFVSMASHEFRTPLAIIDATAQRMKNQATKNRLKPEDAIARVEKIRNAVKRMTRLMESTLDAARMEEGKINIEIGECDIRLVLLEVLMNQIEISPSHNITCDLQELPDMIQGDRGALIQVFTNLLSNAVKYAPDAPDIEVKGHTEGDQVVISVCDHGMGIDEDELGRIGERFFRARTSTGTAGTGIGLNLAKMLVTMHDGTISVESKKDEGSTFTIHLPIAGRDQSEQADSLVA